MEPLDMLYMAFQDADGMMGFSIAETEGKPEKPSFTVDEKHKSLSLTRRPGQVIKLTRLDELVLLTIAKAHKIRFLETPAESSNIVRRYEAVDARKPAKRVS